MANDDLKLDQKEFAKMIASSHQVSDELDPETIVKRKLTIYLTAYYLAEKFNDLQAQSLNGEKPSNQDYQQLLKQLQETKFGDWWTSIQASNW